MASRKVKKFFVYDAHFGDVRGPYTLAEAKKQAESGDCVGPVHILQIHSTMRTKTEYTWET